MDLIYEPLPSGNHTRVLEVWEDPGSHDLRCKFNVVCLDDNEQEYTALSYAWEHLPSTGSIKFSNGQLLRINVTISTLFDSLRKDGKPFTLWIDAICMNQDDIVEKASQVRLMGQIYSQAKQVLLWLGPSSGKIQEAFQFMRSKEDLVWPDDWDMKQDLTGLESLFSVLERPYFQRTWVIQEITLSDNVMMACGDDRVDFDSFASCILAIWKFLEGWNKYYTDSDSIRGLFCLTRLTFIRDEYLNMGEVQYETLLQAALHCKATDYRDMVFAFRGIGAKGALVPEPDYDISVEEIYTRTAIGLLCCGTSIDYLALGGTGFRDRPSNLPSWVPDLRCHTNNEPFVPCEGGSWDTGGPLEVPPTTILPNKLRIQTRFFDTAFEICPPFLSNSVGRSKTVMNQVVLMRRHLPHEISRETWLDKVAPTLIFNLNIDDEPAGPEYLEYYHEWLEWLTVSTSDANIAKIASNEYHRTMGLRIDAWKIFMTKGGYLCVGPPNVEEGDLICVVPGCRFPLVFRLNQKNSESEHGSTYTLISWCYVQDIMQGERIGEGEILNILLE